MGDRLATIDIGRKVGAAVPLFVEELGPQLTQCRLGRGLPPCVMESNKLDDQSSDANIRKPGNVCCACSDPAHGLLQCPKLPRQKKRNAISVYSKLAQLPSTMPQPA